jgi:hypothetical protein
MPCNIGAGVTKLTTATQTLLAESHPILLLIQAITVLSDPSRHLEVLLNTSAEITDFPRGRFWLPGLQTSLTRLLRPTSRPQPSKSSRSRHDLFRHLDFNLFLIKRICSPLRSVYDLGASVNLPHRPICPSLGNNNNPPSSLSDLCL